MKHRPFSLLRFPSLWITQLMSFDPGFLHLRAVHDNKHASLTLSLTTLTSLSLGFLLTPC